MPDISLYPGEELVLFEKAVNWKRYFSSFIKPYINGRVLEAGAGLGANTLLLYTPAASEWVLLEPDTEMAGILENKINQQQLPASCKLMRGTIAQFEKKEQFDTIIYIDVLEHIEQDREELEMAAHLLNHGGHLIILSPAFQFLFSPFDKAIGHYRRYTKSTLQKQVPVSLIPVQLRYLDTTGYFLSMINRMLLRKKYPTQKQVITWDRAGIPISRITDRIMNYSFGKTILGTWKKG